MRTASRSARSSRAVIGDDPVLRSAYRLCRTRTRRQDPAEYALIQLVPAVLRPACWALWAAANAIDDLADDHTATAAERAARVDEWVTALDRELTTGTSTDPIRLALVDTASRWRLDLSGLRGAMRLVERDAHGRSFADWSTWSSWGRGNLLPWFDQIRDLFDRAGVPVTLRLDRQEVYEEFLDGVRLTDILTDLSADLAQGDLLLPGQALHQYPGSSDDLAHRRWSPAVADLITHLTDLARQWVAQPSLARGMHPGPATVLDAMAALLRTQLDAVDDAGPAVLHTPPRPPRATTARLLAPARARAVLAWSLTPLTVPPPRRDAEQCPPSAAVPTARRPAFRSPPPHPSGARPPHVPAEQMPTHVAVIMDGNGRWAQQRGLPRHEGHRAGAAATLDVVRGAVDIGLKHLTLYAFSTENRKRGTEETGAILDLLCRQTREFPDDLDIRMRWHGRVDGLPQDLVDVLNMRERNSRDCTGLTLTTCVNYGGRDEITRTAAALARRVRSGQLDPDLIGERDFARCLADPDMPDVDLLWRTGKEQRISNFLPWHTAYAELCFTGDLWPEVDRRHLWQAITEYTRRQRRHGAAEATGPVIEGGPRGTAEARLP
ncbi:polyprenyl diphosphate synthase [Streptomyces sp. NPDC006516]|uniref:polyprenyl diphosphate synthase n=1 Tax=Streptomyces sp. NPDC006516 TaxID=3154309 RepID=UPI0033A3A7B1